MNSVFATLLFTATLCACTPTNDLPSAPPATPQKMNVTVGHTSFSVVLADNAAAQAFYAQLPLTLTMQELNGNEKYHYLPHSLPTATEHPATIKQGDLMLFGSECLALFYASFSNTYRYTPIGRIDDPIGLETALGKGSVAVTFSR